MVDAVEYKFSVEWYDELAGLSRPYILTFSEYNNGDPSEVSIFDVSKKRMFLKRGPLPQNQNTLSLGDFFKGSLVTIYARQFKVTGYADYQTTEHFTRDRGLVVCTIPASSYRDFGTVISTAQRSGFLLTRLKTVADPTGPGIQMICEFSGKTGGARDDLWDCLFRGSSNPALRSVDVRFSDQEADEIFKSSSTTATFDHCSLLIIKPHALKGGKTGSILSAVIDSNFEVSAAQLFTLQRKEIENFAEVYKGVIPPSDYSNMTLELASGPCIAVEVRAENAVKELRELCGPSDVEVSKALRPNTLRARFGENRIQNAVHCTDLEEDGVLESQYFFDIMLNAISESRHK